MRNTSTRDQTAALHSKPWPPSPPPHSRFQILVNSSEPRICGSGPPTPAGWYRAGSEKSASVSLGLEFGSCLPQGAAIRQHHPWSNGFRPYSRKIVSLSLGQLSGTRSTSASPSITALVAFRGRWSITASELGFSDSARRMSCFLAAVFPPSQPESGTWST